MTDPEREESSSLQGGEDVNTNGHDAQSGARSRSDSNSNSNSNPNSNSNANPNSNANANPNSNPNPDDVPDVSHGSSSAGNRDSPAAQADQRRSQNEIYERLIDGRGAAESVVLETPHGPIHCDIDLNTLSLKTRWDCLKSLPDGMFQAADERADEGDEGDANTDTNVELSADVIPGGDGVKMLQLIVKESLSASELSDGDFNSLIENDLRDEVLIQVGMGILEMSFDRGQVTGFRFE